MREAKDKTCMSAAAMRFGGLGIALLLSACVTTHPPLEASQPGEAAASAPALTSYTAVDGLVPHGKTVVRLRGKSYPEAFEPLRVVGRDSTASVIAAQVAFNVAFSAIAGRPTVHAQVFSKDDLIGDPLPELVDQSWASNPGLKDLPQALGDIATRVYGARAWTELERGRHETGWTRADMETAAQLPAEADAPVNPGVWRLVYENLSGSDELYRLQFSAGLALASLHFGLPPIPAECFYRSEPMDWKAWRANNWQQLREERAKALAQCVETLGQTKAALW